MAFKRKVISQKELKFKIFNLLMRGCLFELETEAHEFIQFELEI